MAVKLYVFESVEDAWDFENMSVEDESEEGEEEEEDEEREEPDPKPARKQAKRTRVGSRREISDDKIGAMIERVQDGKLTNKEAALALGLSVANWYQKAARYRKEHGIASKKAVAGKRAPGAAKFPGEEVEEQEEKPSWEETRDEVQRLQAEGKNSLQIAKQLRISLKEINKYWSKDLAGGLALEEDEAEDEA